MFMFTLLLFLQLISGVVGVEDSALITEDTARIAFLDLTEGEATLIRTEENHNFLINTGSPESYQELKQQLDALHVKDIDAIFLTHQSKDYCGNVKKLIDSYHSETVYHAGKKQTGCFQKIKSDLHTIKLDEQEKKDLDDVKLKVIYTDDEKMAIHVTYHSTGVIFFATGTIEEELHILKQHLTFQIIKIGDYGQGKAPSERFLHDTDPHIAVVFQMKGTTINDGLIERMQELWMDVYRMKQTGTLIIDINEEEYFIPAD
ncbi:ComEC/Rec2 family competence protein [Thalassobacillus hwangdonensis]